MITLFSIIAITSILVLGFHIVTNEGMALFSIRIWAMKKEDEGKLWAEPLCLCIWCMPSIWSLAGFVFAFGIGVLDNFTWNLLFYYPLCVAGSSLICGLIWTMYEAFVSVKDKNEEEIMYFNDTNRELDFDNHIKNYNN